MTDYQLYGHSTPTSPHYDPQDHKHQFKSTLQPLLGPIPSILYRATDHHLTPPHHSRPSSSFPQETLLQEQTLSSPPEAYFPATPNTLRRASRRPRRTPLRPSPSTKSQTPTPHSSRSSHCQQRPETEHYPTGLTLYTWSPCTNLALPPLSSLLWWETPASGHRPSQNPSSTHQWRHFPERSKILLPCVERGSKREDHYTSEVCVCSEQGI